MDMEIFQHSIVQVKTKVGVIKHQGSVVQSTISANLGLPVNLLLWFRLLWLNNLVQISQLEIFFTHPIFVKEYSNFSHSVIRIYPQNFSLILD